MNLITVFHQCSCKLIPQISKISSSSSSHRCRPQSSLSRTIGSMRVMGLHQAKMLFLRWHRAIFPMTILCNSILLLNPNHWVATLTKIHRKSSLRTSMCRLTRLLSTTSRVRLSRKTLKSPRVTMRKARLLLNRVKLRPRCQQELSRNQMSYLRGMQRNLSMRIWKQRVGSRDKQQVTLTNRILLFLLLMESKLRSQGLKSPLRWKVLEQLLRNVPEMMQWKCSKKIWRLVKSHLPQFSIRTIYRNSANLLFLRQLMSPLHPTTLKLQWSINSPPRSIKTYPMEMSVTTSLNPARMLKSILRSKLAKLRVTLTGNPLIRSYKKPPEVDQISSRCKMRRKKTIRRQMSGNKMKNKISQRLIHRSISERKQKAFLVRFKMWNMILNLNSITLNKFKN